MGRLPRGRRTGRSDLRTYGPDPNHVFRQRAPIGPHLPNFKGPEVTKHVFRFKPEPVPA